MKTIILRHAEAVDLSRSGGSDRDRPLTQRGEKQAELAGRILKTMGLIPRTVWSSPYPRAMQTAQIAARQWGNEKAIHAMAFLAPGEDAEEIIRQIGSSVSDEPLMLVGHNPGLEDLVSNLITSSGLARINLGKGSIAVIEVDEPVCLGCATLKGLWSSGQMKTLRPD